MADYSVVINKINNILKNSGVETITGNFDDIKEIIRNSFENVYKGINKKSKREIVVKTLINIFIDNYVNIKSYCDEIVENLEKMYPADDDYQDLYYKALEEYNLFIENFKKDKNINIETLTIITKKLIVLATRHKDQILRLMSVHNSKYDTMVVHCVNSTIIAIIGGYNLNIKDERLVNLGISGLLHDIGMFLIPSEILNKSGKLTEDEYNTIKTHTVLAYKIINTLNIDKEIVDGVLQHHEQYDGNGYPKKIKGDEISEFAKILAISDAYEAQISKRNYRNAKNSYDAMKEVISNSNNRFDPNIMKGFLKSLSIYPPGTLVQLNDYSIGLVDSVNESFPLRPKIRLIIDKNGNKCTNKVYVDLRNDNSLFVAMVLNKEDYKK